MVHDVDSKVVSAPGKVSEASPADVFQGMKNMVDEVMNYATSTAKTQPVTILS